MYCSPYEQLPTHSSLRSRFSVYCLTRKNSTGLLSYSMGQEAFCHTVQTFCHIGASLRHQSPEQLKMSFQSAHVSSFSLPSCSLTPRRCRRIGGWVWIASGTEWNQDDEVALPVDIRDDIRTHFLSPHMQYRVARCPCLPRECAVVGIPRHGTQVALDSQARAGPKTFQTFVSL